MLWFSSSLQKLIAQHLEWIYTQRQKTSQVSLYYLYIHFMLILQLCYDTLASCKGRDAPKKFGVIWTWTDWLCTEWSTVIVELKPRLQRLMNRGWWELYPALHEFHHVNDWQVSDATLGSDSFHSTCNLFYNRYGWGKQSTACFVRLSGKRTLLNSVTCTELIVEMVRR